MLNYLRSIVDSFGHGQTHLILRSSISLMVKVPAAIDHLEAEFHTGLILFTSFLDMVFQIREKRTAERRKLYLRTVSDTIDDWKFPDHSK